MATFKLKSEIQVTLRPGPGPGPLDPLPRIPKSVRHTGKQRLQTCEMTPQARRRKCMPRPPTHARAGGGSERRRSLPVTVPSQPEPEAPSPSLQPGAAAARRLETQAEMGLGCLDR
jgi:hypothetical protein